MRSFLLISGLFLILSVLLSCNKEYLSYTVETVDATFPVYEQSNMIGYEAEVSTDNTLFLPTGSSIKASDKLEDIYNLIIDVTYIGNPGDMLYVRIKILDGDGTITYSDIGRIRKE